METKDEYRESEVSYAQYVRVCRKGAEVTEVRIGLSTKGDSKLELHRRELARLVHDHMDDRRCVEVGDMLTPEKIDELSELPTEVLEAQLQAMEKQAKGPRRQTYVLSDNLDPNDTVTFDFRECSITTTTRLAIDTILFTQVMWHRMWKMLYEARPPRVGRAIEDEGAEEVCDDLACLEGRLPECPHPSHAEHES